MLWIRWRFKAYKALLFKVNINNFFPNDIENLRKIDDRLEVKGIKNLIFKTKDKSQIFFIIIPWEERFDEKLFRNKYELPKISMAKEEDLKELLLTRTRYRIKMHIFKLYRSIKFNNTTNNNINKWNR